MTRRTLDQTRQLLLDVGLRLLHERRVYVSVTHVRLTDVVKEAGLTTGAAYRCWENQDAYHRDLAVAAARWRDRASVAETVEAVRGLVEAGAPFAEVLRVGAEANVYEYPEHTATLTTIALRTCAPADPAIAEAGRYHLNQAVEAFAELYDMILPLYGRRLRAPYTTRDLATVLIAVSEGFTLQGVTGQPYPRVRRHDVEPGVGTDWTLFGCAVEAIAERFTEVTPDEPPVDALDDDEWTAPFAIAPPSGAAHAGDPAPEPAPAPASGAGPGADTVPDR
jgi:AcrR family transcriptional regulator